MEMHFDSLANVGLVFTFDWRDHELWIMFCLNSMRKCVALVVDYWRKLSQSDLLCVRREYFEYRVRWPCILYDNHAHYIFLNWIMHIILKYSQLAAYSKLKIMEITKRRLSDVWERNRNPSRRLYDVWEWNKNPRRKMCNVMVKIDCWVLVTTPRTCDTIQVATTVYQSNLMNNTLRQLRFIQIHYVRQFANSLIKEDRHRSLLTIVSLTIAGKVAKRWRRIGREQTGKCTLNLSSMTKLPNPFRKPVYVSALRKAHLTRSLVIHKGNLYAPKVYNPVL